MATELEDPMSCDQHPDSGGEFADFLKAVNDSDVHRPVPVSGFHPLIRTLRAWAEVRGMPSCAACTHRVLRILTARHPEALASLGWTATTAVNLLRAFGASTTGDVVGHMGRDMLTPLLGHEHVLVRRTALEVLVRWAGDEELFVPMLQRHIAREGDPGLRRYCRRELEWLEELADDPEFTSGSSDITDELEDLERELARDAELAPYFEARRELPNSLRAIVRHPELPPFLERVVGLHRHITLGLLESSQVGHPCVRESTLEVHVDRGVVRAWNRELAVSLEPTATSGSWLVFARW